MLMRVININFPKMQKILSKKKENHWRPKCCEIASGLRKNKDSNIWKEMSIKVLFFFNKNYLKQQQLVQYIGYNTNTTLLVYSNDLTKLLASSRCLMFSNTWEDLEPLVTLATDPAAVFQHLRIIWRPMKGSNSFQS